MLEFRKIVNGELESLKNLSNIVISNLERKEFFMPFSDEVYNDLFDENKIIAYGAYDGNNLVGTAQLFVGDYYVNEIKEILNIKNYKVADLGGYLVLPTYRNQGIMKKLEAILVDKAKELNYDYIVITAHPENTYSNAAIKNTGAELVKVFTTGSGYLRNLYLLDLKK